MADVLLIEALFDESLGPNLTGPVGPRELLGAADIVIAVDVMSGQQVVVHGKGRLDEIITTGASKVCRIVRIGLDVDTDELERLTALMMTIKGEYDGAFPLEDEEQKEW